MISALPEAAPPIDSLELPEILKSPLVLDERCVFQTADLGKKLLTHGEKRGWNAPGLRRGILLLFCRSRVC